MLNREGFGQTSFIRYLTLPMVRTASFNTRPDFETGTP